MIIPQDLEFIARRHKILPKTGESTNDFRSRLDRILEERRLLSVARTTGLTERIKKVDNDIYHDMPYDEIVEALKGMDFSIVYDQRGVANGCQTTTELWSDGRGVLVESFCVGSQTSRRGCATAYLELNLKKPVGSLTKNEQRLFWEITNGASYDCPGISSTAVLSVEEEIVRVLTLIREGPFSTNNPWLYPKAHYINEEESLVRLAHLPEGVKKMLGYSP